MFSVIIEGSASGKGPSEETWEELERYLHSARIPAKLVKQLKPGKPQVLKNELSYEQAVDISDRLMDLGLQSIIDPPIKPDLAKINPAKSIAAPAQAAANNCHINGRVNGRITVNGKSQNGRRGPAAGTAPAPIGNTKASQAGTSELNGRPSPRAAGKPAHPVLAKAAAEIRALFQLPKGGKLDIQLPKTSAIRLWCITCLSLLIPILLVAAFATAAIAAMAALVALYGLLFGLMPPLGIVLIPVLSLILLTAGILLVLPFCSRPGQHHNGVAIQAKDEPRLVMLVAAICKVTGAPAPSSTYLDAEPHLRGRLHGSLSEFLAFRKPMDGKVTITLGTPLLASLSIHDLAVLIAGECGRFSQPGFRRHYWIILGILAWLHACGQGERLSRRLARATHDRSESLQGYSARAAGLTDSLQDFSYRVIGFCEQRLAALLDKGDPVARQYQAAVLGNSDLTGWRQMLADTREAHCDAISDMLSDRCPQALVDSLSALSRDHLEKNYPASRKTTALTGIVKSAQPASLLIARFDEYDKRLSRRFYEAQGFKLAAIDLLPLVEMQRREASETRLRKIAHGYYGNWFHELQIWRLPNDNLNDVGEKALASRLNHSISKVRYMSPDRSQLLAKYYKLLKHLTELKAAKKIVSTGASFKFRYCADASHNFDKEIALRTSRLKEYGEELRQQNTVMGERLALGLALDKQHKSTVKKLSAALMNIHGIAEKINRLVCDIEELSILQEYKPKNPSQQYQLHIKELTERVEATCRLLRRKLHLCPYDFYDRRYSTLGALLDNRLAQQPAAGNSAESTTKAEIVSAVITQAYRNISDLAASYATRMEHAYEIDAIKRV
ncbi:MAG: hypothetical protein WDZ30_04730 [Cellvibrionaceae bacterium]